MKLVETGRGEFGRTNYRTQDYRFTVMWVERQGARSGYNVTDTRMHKVLRADNLNEAREAIREMTIGSLTDEAQPRLQPGDELYYVAEIPPVNDEDRRWEIRSQRVAQVRIDGWRFERTFGSAGTHAWRWLDKTYHRSHEAAIAAYIDGKRGEIESLRGQITEAERAIACLGNMSGQPNRKPRRSR